MSVGTSQRYLGDLSGGLGALDPVACEWREAERLGLPPAESDRDCCSWWREAEGEYPDELGETGEWDRWGPSSRNDTPLVSLVELLVDAVLSMAPTVEVDPDRVYERRLEWDWRSW